MEKKRFIKKVCLLGDGGVGKTSLIGRYVLNCFNDNYIMSFGTKVSKKVIDYEDAQLTLMIWDILGQKSQKALHGAYYSGANGVLLVCDNTRPDTLLHLTEWKKDLEDVVGAVPLVPIINKADLPTALMTEDIAAVRAVMGRDFLHTSAKNGSGVQEAFERLGRQILGVPP